MTFSYWSETFLFHAWSQGCFWPYFHFKKIWLEFMLPRPLLCSDDFHAATIIVKATISWFRKFRFRARQRRKMSPQLFVMLLFNSLKITRAIVVDVNYNGGNFGNGSEIVGARWYFKNDCVCALFIDIQHNYHYVVLWVRNISKDVQVWGSCSNQWRINELIIWSLDQFYPNWDVGKVFLKSSIWTWERGIIGQCINWKFFSNEWYIHP